MTIEFTLNGSTVTADAVPGQTLIEMLRDTFNLIGTKEGCGAGDCGACTVLMDGKPVSSCLVFSVECGGHTITTIEGVSANGALHPIQKAFEETGAVQCGYCTPGMILTGIGLLKENPKPSEAEIRRAIAGNLCRCTGYDKIVKAIMHASRENPEHVWQEVV